MGDLPEPKKQFQLQGSSSQGRFLNQDVMDRKDRRLSHMVGLDQVQGPRSRSADYWDKFQTNQGLKSGFTRLVFKTLQKLSNQKSSPYFHFSVCSGTKRPRSLLLFRRSPLPTERRPCSPISCRETRGPLRARWPQTPRSTPSLKGALAPERAPPSQTYCPGIGKPRAFRKMEFPDRLPASGNPPSLWKR